MTQPALPDARRLAETLLSPRHHGLFDTITRRALTEEDGDAWAANFIRSCPASHGERLLIQLAYSLWRGYGPAIRVDQIQGVEEDVAARLLAGLALAAVGPAAKSALQRASALCAVPTPDQAGTP